MTVSGAVASPVSAAAAATSPSSSFTTASSPSLISIDTVRATNWAGGIPTVVSLAPTSLSSPTIPPPIHILLPRHSFLHVGLRSAVLRLASFAPLQPILAYGNRHHNNNKSSSSISSNSQKIIRNESDGEDDTNDGEQDDSNNNNNNANAIRRRSSSMNNNNSNNNQDSYPICWFEDEEGQIALRWHLFAGVLYDMTKVYRYHQQQPLLPWKIRLHFTSYPHGQLLPLESSPSSSTITNTDDAAAAAAAATNCGVMATLQRSFKHSLKQALFLQYGNSRVSLNLTKQSYERLWESIVACNYYWYRQVNSTELEVSSTMTTSTTQSSANSISEIHMIPIRLFIDSQPPQQRPCRPMKDDHTPYTLGDLLFEWAPQYFSKHTVTDNLIDESGSIQPNLPHITWWIGGIQPPLTCSLLDLWRHLCHPDHMLYIVLVTRPS